MMEQIAVPDNERQQALQTLLDAELLYIAPPSTEEPVSEVDLRAATVVIGADGSLSADIIAERVR